MRRVAVFAIAKRTDAQDSDSLDIMSHGDVEIEERPKKKRRFFVDDVDEPALNPEPSLPDEPAPPHGDSSAPTTNGAAVGFDPEGLEAIIGERLSLADVKKLDSLSNGNLEQGGMDMCYVVYIANNVQLSTCTLMDRGERLLLHLYLPL